MSDRRMSGQVSIVTGGAGGIADLNAEGAEHAARALGDEGGSALAVGVDITAQADRERLVSEALERYSRIDVLVNNAGIMHRVGLLEVTPEVWHRTMQVNLDAAFFCSQAVVSTMRAQGKGRIVNISSMAARTGGQ